MSFSKESQQRVSDTIRNFKCMHLHLVLCQLQPKQEIFNNLLLNGIAAFCASQAVHLVTDAPQGSVVLRMQKHSAEG